MNTEKKKKTHTLSISKDFTLSKVFCTFSSSRKKNPTLKGNNTEVY